MGKNWPLQRAHPFGAKLKETILISLRKGSDISPPKRLKVVRFQVILTKELVVSRHLNPSNSQRVGKGSGGLTVASCLWRSEDFKSGALGILACVPRNYKR